jgi:lipopolysaccharide/colanic/teichoic acid biosynthesis glycosyltransferase
MAVQSRSIESIIIHANYLKAKRIFDIAFTLLVAPFVLLVGVVVALWIKLDSKGPIFYRQKRVGLNGVEFEMLKFRSMYINSDSNVHREKIIKYMSGEKLNEDGTGDMAYKHLHDSRVTRIGRFIRKTSLDEVPQFWNVLRGEMTLVGPRPPVPYEVERYSARDWLRLVGKPGLTGPWQVYGRSRVTFYNMVDMDITYLQKQSLWYDIQLIFLTVPVMIFGRGGA